MRESKNRMLAVSDRSSLGNTVRRIEVLLLREDLHLSREAEEAVRFVYERSLEIQALAKERLPQAITS
jgi:hypothetical protein